MSAAGTVATRLAVTPTTNQRDTATIHDLLALTDDDDVDTRATEGNRTTIIADPDDGEAQSAGERVRASPSSCSCASFLTQNLMRDSFATCLRSF
jgi:hypothetical protein